MNSLGVFCLNSFVILGVCFLGFSLFPIRWLTKQLPRGGLRTKWNILSGLIAIFVVGYIVYAALFCTKYTNAYDLIVPSIFFFGAAFVLLVGTLAFQTAIDLKRITTLEFENITDPLIGIHNRRYLEQRLDEEFSRANRYDLPLSFLMLDVDHFKHINDTFGHNIGDIVLTSLGRITLRVVRDTDIVARFGGEEIAIIAPQTTIESAKNLAERLRQEIERTVLVPPEQNKDKKEVPVTVSIGVSEILATKDHKNHLIKRADEALYEAKKNGRNQVVVKS